MTEYEISILKNTIEQMASDADDKGNDRFGITLTVSDAFEICKWKPLTNAKYTYGKTKHQIVCSNCGANRLFSKVKNGYFLVCNANYCPNCGAKMDEESE